MITLLLAIRDRPYCLKRTLLYYKKSQFPFRIIVLDSSSNFDKKINKETINSLSTPFFSPFYVDIDKSYSYAKKLFVGSNYIETPYACIASCDDFFSVQGLKECAYFLQKNTEYNFSHGYHYGFTHDKNKINWYFIGNLDNIRSFQESSPMDRLNSFINNPAYFPYTLFKSPYLIKSLEFSHLYTNGNVKNSEAFWETTFMLSTIFYGKGKLIKVPYFYKEIAQSSTGGKIQKSYLLSEHFITHKNKLFEGINFLLKDMDETIQHEYCNKILEAITYKTLSITVNKKLSHLEKICSLLQPKIIAKISLFGIRGFKFYRQLAQKYTRNLLLTYQTKPYLISPGTPYFEEFTTINTEILESNILAHHPEANNCFPLLLTKEKPEKDCL